MQTDLLNIALGFLEGFALIISPCILPILPIILAGSLTGSKRRPLGIITGFVIIFSIFTFFSRKLVQLSGIDLNLIRHISYGILFLLGVIMMSTYLTDKFGLLTQRLAQVGSKPSSNNPSDEGFFSGLLFGGLVALIWTPCAGPILAAVIVQTVIQQTSLMGFFTIMAFALGAAGPMLIIALFGRTIMPKLGFIKSRTVVLRKVLGAIIIAAVAYMIYSEGGVAIASSTSNNNTAAATQLDQGLEHPYPAPAIGGISAWINSQPLQLSDLKGKVVLIDFWTYSCINCIRTLPYIKDLYNKYHDKGLVIIGIHTPEFDFEKDLNNVKAAVIKDDIKYPVALDDQFVTWQNFNNSYWPAHYLIDKKGDVVYTHFGEGSYAETENNIRYLLGLKGPAKESVARAPVSSANQTPETYFGFDRAQAFVSLKPVIRNQVASYSFPPVLPLHGWGIQGSWIIYGNRIVTAEKNAALMIHFYAGKVFIVMGSSMHKPITVKLMLNDKPNKTIVVSDHRLYDALSFDHPQDGTLTLEPQGAGLEIYTFTFGE